MFVKDQTLVYKPNGQRARVKETPDQCLMHLGLPNKDPVPAYAIQFYVETPEGPVEDPMVMVAPKGLVETHFRLPAVGESFPAKVLSPGEAMMKSIDDFTPTLAAAFVRATIGPQTQASIAALTNEPTRGTGSPTILTDEAEGGGDVVLDPNKHWMLQRKPTIVVTEIPVEDSREASPRVVTIPKYQLNPGDIKINYDAPT